MRGPIRPWTRADRVVLRRGGGHVRDRPAGGDGEHGLPDVTGSHNFAVTVDALILDSDIGCFGAYGSGAGWAGKSTITYTVEFPYAGAPTVRRCPAL